MVKNLLIVVSYLWLVFPFLVVLVVSVVVVVLVLGYFNHFNQYNYYNSLTIQKPNSCNNSRLLF